MIESMRVLAFVRSAFSGVAVAMLASCGQQAVPFDSVLRSAPGYAHGDNAHSSHDAANRGIYVSGGSAVLGYLARDRRNKPPICTVYGSAPGGIASDSDGNLINTDAAVNVVLVFKGPKDVRPRARIV